MALQAVPLKDFRGGLNTRDSVADLNANESPDLENVSISSLVGQLQTRKGQTRIDTGVGLAGSPKIDHAKQAVIGATGKRFLMLSINGGIYICEPNGEVKKLFAGTAATVWDFEVYSDAAGKDWVYMGNGVDAMQKWDGEAAATVEWAATKGTIPKGGVLCVWENRMFISYVGTQVQRLYFSEFADPEATIAEYGFVDIRGSEEDLDAIQDLAVLGARLIVLKRRGVFFVSSAVSMLNRHIGGPGVWSRFQVAEMEDKLYFFNPQGIFSTSGVAVAMESGSINNWFPAHLAPNELNGVRVVATKDTYPRLMVSMSTKGLPEPRSLFNDTILEMVPHINFRRIGGRRYLLLPAFFVHNIPAHSLATWNPKGTEELLVGSSIQGLGSFPELTPLDTFQRVLGVDENPLTDGGKWTKWVWTTSAGMLKANGAEPSVGVIGKAAKELIGARWNVGEFNNPQAFIMGGEFGIEQLAVNICFAAVAQSGYTLRLIQTGEAHGEPVYTLRLERWTAGAKVILWEQKEFIWGGGVKGIGLEAAEGKIQVWVHQAYGAEGPSESYWYRYPGGEVADATYAKGYSGFELQSAQGNVVSSDSSAHNFASAELAKSSQLFKLFNGTTDNGKVIEAHWRSSWIAIQEQEPRERLRRLDAQINGDAKVSVFTDYDESTVKFEKELPKRGVLKEFDEPSSSTQFRFSRVRPETYGRYHQVMFSSIQGGTPFTIVSAELRVRGGKEH